MGFGLRRAIDRLRPAVNVCKRKLGLQLASITRSAVRRKYSEGIGILMYHRITNRIAGLREPTWNVTPNRFRQQLVDLLALGYQPQPLTKVLDFHEQSKEIPSNWFVLTFDDIYENVFTNAWPVLMEYNIPATVFVATAFLDSIFPFPFDDWVHSGEAEVDPTHWRPITTEQCRQMLASGLIEIGAHTHTHQDFRGRPEEMLEDLLVCKRLLHERFAIENPTFAFPYGTRSLGFSGPGISEVAKRAGVRCSLTTEDQQVLAEDDPFDWGRFTAEEFDTGRTLAAKLDGWFTFFKNSFHRPTSDRGCQ